jgi:alcohol dehydrogenase (NADP+)
MKTSGYAASSATSPLAPFSFERRTPGAQDVYIDILYCGVCHSDLHTARNEWRGTVYPVVPGHEIVGRVIAVGRDVTRFKAGDRVGVGCLVDSCGHCASCAQGLEQYCETGYTLTYNSPDPFFAGAMTYGGYSSQVVVDQRFVVSVPESLDLAGVAPLLCAGITTYSPLRHWGAGPGRKVGVIGLGGLGHMGLKLAHAMGAHTALFTTSPDKTADARRLGADDVIVSKNADEMQKHANSFDLILDTVSASHNLDTYVNLLKRDGTLCLLGLPEHPHPSPDVAGLLMKRRQITGSAIGGLRETQEMLNFCGEHGIVSDIETIRIDDINEAYERMLRSDVKYRFVIDMASLKNNGHS